MPIKLRTRKLQRNGRGHHVNVPAVWVANLGIEKGATINCEIDQDGRLILTAGEAA